MSARLLVSISALRGKSLAEAQALAAELDRRGVGLSLLVAPRRGQHWRLVDDPEAQAWLRGRRERGDAIVLGGYDQAATKRRRAEFASITAGEARVRLAAADRLLADLGLRTRVFAAPRWNTSPGAIEALPETGFRLCAELGGIHDLVRRSTIESRVLSIGEGFVSDAWWCRAMVAAAERTAAAGGLVRLNVAATKLHKQAVRSAILDAVDAATGAYGARPVRYAWHPSAHEAAA